MEQAHQILTQAHHKARRMIRVAVAALAVVTAISAGAIVVGVRTRQNLQESEQSLAPGTGRGCDPAAVVPHPTVSSVASCDRLRPNLARALT